MPVMERTASRDNRSICYECPKCRYVVRRPIARKLEIGGFAYDERLTCPRCLSMGIQTPPEEQDE